MYRSILHKKKNEKEM